MIELPHGVMPNSATPRLVDMGFVQQSAGGSATRIDRPGNRMEVEFTFPPMPADQARAVVARIARAKSAGIRVEYPLLGQDQGAPGSPVVNGTDSGGRTLKLRALTPGYVVKEGYWLNLIGPDGTLYLHLVAAPTNANASGQAVLTVEPPLRIFPADGALVNLTRPVIEGQLVSDASWDLALGDIVTGLKITVREAA